MIKTDMDIDNQKYTLYIVFSGATDESVTISGTLTYEVDDGSTGTTKYIIYKFVETFEKGSIFYESEVTSSYYKIDSKGFRNTKVTTDGNVRVSFGN